MTEYEYTKNKYEADEYEMKDIRNFTENVENTGTLMVKINKYYTRIYVLPTYKKCVGYLIIGLNRSTSNIEEIAEFLWENTYNVKSTRYVEKYLLKSADKYPKIVEGGTSLDPDYTYIKDYKKKKPFFYNHDKIYIELPVFFIQGIRLDLPITGVEIALKYKIDEHMQFIHNKQPHIQYFCMDNRKYPKIYYGSSEELFDDQFIIRADKHLNPVIELVIPGIPHNTKINSIFIDSLPVYFEEVSYILRTLEDIEKFWIFFNKSSFISSMFEELKDISKDKFIEICKNKENWAYLKKHNIMCEYTDRTFLVTPYSTSLEDAIDNLDELTKINDVSDVEIVEIVVNFTGVISKNCQSCDPYIIDAFEYARKGSIF